MMRKLSILFIVFGFAALASATVVDVVIDGVGSAGHTGAVGNELEAGEWIKVKLVLNENPYPGWPTYDGYVLSSMDLGLDVSGAGTLGVAQLLDKLGDPMGDDWGEHADWTFPGSPVIVDDSIDQMLYASTGGITAAAGTETIIWNLIITAGTTAGEITLDLTAGTGANLGGEYSEFTDINGDAPYPGDWLKMVDADLGDLTLNVVPEPMTLGLLGLGGLLMRRKKK